MDTLRSMLSDIVRLVPGKEGGWRDEEYSVLARDLHGYINEQIIDANDLTLCLSALLDEKTGIFVYLSPSKQFTIVKNQKIFNEQITESHIIALQAIAVVLERCKKKHVEVSADAALYAMKELFTIFKIGGKSKDMTIEAMRLLASTQAFKYNEQADGVLSPLLEEFHELLINISEYLLPGWLVENEKKATPTSKGIVYSLLALFSKKYPSVMSQESGTRIKKTAAERLFELAQSNLRAQHAAKLPSQRYMAECMNCITSLLTNFSDTLNLGDMRTEFYKYVKIALNKRVLSELKLYSVPVAALKALKEHAHLFGQYIMKDCEYIYESLMSVCLHNNRDLRATGFFALESCLNQISSDLDSENPSLNQKTAFRYLLKSSVSKLELAQSGFTGSTSEMTEVAISIRTAGMLCTSARHYVDNAEIERLISRILIACKYTVKQMSVVQDDSSTSSVYNENLHYITAYLRSFSTIIMVTKEINETMNEILGELLTSVFLCFPFIYGRRRIALFYSLTNLLASLHFSSESGVLRTLLSSVFKQGILLSSSSKAEIDENEEKSWTQYIDLWTNLFTPKLYFSSTSLKVIASQDHEIESKDYVSNLISMIFSAFMSGVCDILETIELGYRAAPEEQDTVQLESMTTDKIFPVNAKDYAIFLNLVDFLTELIPQCGYDRDGKILLKWIDRFGRLCVDLSKRYPLTSGMYKLLGIIFKQCMTHKYYQTDHNNNTKSLFKSFGKTVLIKSKQYEGDLLASVLDMALNMPFEIIDLVDMKYVLQTALEIGIGYHPLAKASLEAIVYWLSVFPRGEVMKCVKPIMTCFEPYLYTTKSDEPNAERDELKYRVLNVLGKLGGYSTYTVDSTLKISEKAAWDNEERFLFGFPFPNSEMKLFLDKIIPRVISLALEGGSRQSKVAACEVLHSITLNIIAVNAWPVSHTSFQGIYRLLFPALLKLAVDVDSVPKQIFEPLVFQLIRWFTKQAKSEGEGTYILLDSVMEALSSPTSSSLRVLGGECVKEFVVWIQKHHSSAKDGFGFKPLLLRLYSLARHPHPYNRLGAAIGLDKIYREIRKVEKLVSVFGLECIYTLLQALRQSERDASSIRTAPEISSTILKYANVLSQRSEVLLKEDKMRRGTIQLEYLKDLPTFVEWLFSQTVHSYSEYRRTCMLAFKKLSVHSPGCNSVNDWIAKYGKDFSPLNTIDIPNSDQIGIMSGFDRSVIEHMRTICSIVKWIQWTVFEEEFFDCGAISQPVERILELCEQILSERVFCSLKSSNAQYNETMLMFLETLFEIVLCGDPSTNPFTVKLTRNSPFVCTVLAAVMNPNGSISNDDMQDTNDEYVDLVLKGIHISDIQGFAESQINHLRVKTTLAKLIETCRACNESLVLDIVNQVTDHVSFSLTHHLKSELKFELLNGYLTLQETKVLSSNLYNNTELIESLVKSLREYSIVNVGKSITARHTKRGQVLLQLALGFGLDIATVLFPSNDSISGFILFEPYKEQIISNVVSSPKLLDLLLSRFAATTQAQHIILESISHLYVKLNNGQKQDIDRVVGFLNRFLPHFKRVSDALLQSLGFVKTGQSSLDFSQRSLAASTLTSLLKVMLSCESLLLVNGFPEGLCLSREQTWYQDIIDSYSSLIKDREIAPSARKEALSLLPIFIHCDTSDHVLSSGNGTLRNPLDEIVQYDANIAIITEALLQCLAESKNITLLDIVFPLLVRKANESVVGSVLDLFSSGLQEEKVIEVVSYCLNFFNDVLNGGDPPEFLNVSINKVTLPVLLGTTKEIATEVFADKIGFIMGIVKSPLNETDTNKIKAFYMAKLCAFALVELLYKIVDLPVIRDRVNPAYMGKTNTEGLRGNELTIHILKFCSEATKKRLSPDIRGIIGQEAASSYHSAAYSTLASVVSTQTKEDLYLGVLFKEKEEKQEYLWENLIDTETKFMLEVESNFEIAKATIGTLKQQAYPRRMAAPTLKMISSIYLADSSFSEQFGGLGPTLASPPDHMDTTSSIGESSAPSTLASGVSFIGSDTGEPVFDGNQSNTLGSEIELDTINAMPAMAPFLFAIDATVKKFPVKEDMPKWMDAIHQTFTEPNQNPIVQVFIAKVIMNRSTIFKPFAAKFLSPLLKILLYGEEQGLLGNGFHYFFRDLCLLLLEWKGESELKLSTDDLLQATKIINNLMSRSVTPNKVILKSNLDILKLLIEWWNESNMLEIDKSMISELIKPSEETNQNRGLSKKAEIAKYRSPEDQKDTQNKILGLQLICLLATTKIPLFDPRHDGDKLYSFESLSTDIAKLLLASRKEVYITAAVTCGLVLGMYGEDSEQTRLLLPKISSKLESMYLGRSDKYLMCVYRIAENFRGVLHGQVSRIMALVPRMMGEFRVIVLQLAIMCIDVSTEETMISHLKPHIPKFLRDRYNSVHIAIIQLIGKLVRAIDEETAMHWIANDSIVKTFTSHTDEQVREEFYSLLISLYDNFEDLRQCPALVNGLISGLSDSKNEIKEKIRIFWTHDSRLSISSAGNRLIECIEKMYTSEHDHLFIGNSCYFILNLCSKASSYDQVMYRSIDQVKPIEQTIDITADLRAGSGMTPLFAPSLSSSQNMEGFLPSQSVEAGYVRATLPTQGSMSMDPSASIRPSGMIMFTTGKVAPSQSFAQSYTGSFNSDMMPPPATTKSVRSQHGEISVRKRFTKILPNTVQNIMINKAAQTNRQRKAYQERTKAARGRKVILFRKYRKGELPDVEIAPSALIKPLQELCVLDSKVSDSVFSLIYDGIIKGDNDDETVKENLNSSLLHLIKPNSEQVSGSAIVPIVLELSLRVPRLAGFLSPSDIKRVSVLSNCVRLGIVVIEEGMRESWWTKDDEEVRAKKKQKIEDRSDRSGLTDEWSSLIDLYRIMGDDDVIKGIFDRILEDSDETREFKAALVPLDAEFEGDFTEALRNYDRTLTKSLFLGDGDLTECSVFELEDATQRAKDCYSRGLGCLAQLGEWSNVLERTYSDEDLVVNSKWIWQRTDGYQPLGLYLKSSLRNSTGYCGKEEIGNRPISEEIGSIDIEDERLKKLIRSMGSELSLMHASEGRVEQAEETLQKSSDSWYETFSSLPAHNTALQSAMLLELQPKTELGQIFGVIKDIVKQARVSMDQLKNSIISLTNEWTDNWPLGSNHFLAWDDVAFTRIAGLNLIEQSCEGRNIHLENIKLESGLNLSEYLRIYTAKCYEDVAGAARIQRNFKGALCYLKSAKPFVSNTTTSSRASFAQTLFTVRFEEAQNISCPLITETVSVLEEPASKRINDLTNVLRGINAQQPSLKSWVDKYNDQANNGSILDSDRDEYVKCASLYKRLLILKSDILCVLSESIVQLPASVTGVSGSDGKVSDFAKLRHLLFNVDESGDRQDFISDLSSNAFISLKKGLEETIMTDDHVNVEYKMAYFCDKRLQETGQQKSDSSLPPLHKNDIDIHAETMVKCVLSAMSKGHSASANRFPRLLEILRQSFSFISLQTIEKVFEYAMKEITKIPSWMFIRWISWMLASLGQEEIKVKGKKEQISYEKLVIKEIMTRIIADYPQSAVYSFDVSREDFSKESMAFVQPLVDQLNSIPVIATARRLVSSLNLLTFPEHRLKYWCEKVSAELKQAPPGKRTAEQLESMKEYWENARRECFDIGNDGESDYGAYNRNFASRKCPANIKTEKFIYEVYTKLTPQDFAKKMGPIYNSSSLPGGGVSPMKDYSKLLDSFDSDISADIEIPGQYDGMSKPVPETHTKIVGFGNSVVTMGSLRKPKVINIRGDDEKEHKYLVKGGEDIRMDQRVQQLFGIFNGILDSDTACSKRKLLLRTYTVIPMTQYLGLVQWMDGTIPLKALLEDSEKKSGGSSLEKAKNLWMKWLEKITKPLKIKFREEIAKAYREVVFVVGSKQLMENFEKVSESIPWNLLRDGVLSLCTSPGSYLAIRENFSRTLAVFSIVSYIIGIGDRHLDNFLIDKKTGDFIAIDFGHAFGSATQILPIPELVPFRLTRQMTAMLRPLDASALLRRHMIHVLSAVRNSSDFIAGVIDIFAREPLADWKDFAGRVGPRLGLNVQQWRDWYPKQRLDIAKMKLEGHNPASVLTKELHCSMQVGMKSAQKVLTVDRLAHILKGNKERNIRARLPDKGLTVSEQVDALIDHATDTNVYGRSYIGWAPFV